MGLSSDLQRAVKIAAAAVVMTSCGKVEHASSEANLPAAPKSGSAAVLDPAALAPKFSLSDAEQREVVVGGPLRQVARSVLGDGKPLESMFVLNGIHPGTVVVPGSHILRVPDSFRLPDIDRDPAVDPAPVRVELQKGQTLWELAKNFKVDLETLIALNCNEGEREVRNLQPGRFITIPLVQHISREGVDYVFLEGLCVQHPAECQRIAHRLLKSDRGMSARFDHLSRAVQHLMPAERRQFVEHIAQGLEAAADSDHTSGHTESPVASLGRMYADALRSAVDTYSIDNPFRVSPLALLDIVETRKRLDVGDRAQLCERVFMVCTSDGDANGAFSSVNKVIEAAMTQGISVVYFQTGSCSEIVQAGDRVKEVLGRGVDGLIIGGHGGQVSVSGEAKIELGYTSTIRRAKGSDPSALQDLCVLGGDGKVLEKFATLVREDGSIGFISCFSGEGGPGLRSNLVNQVARAASQVGHKVHIVGCREATNVESVDFQGARLKMNYLNGGTYELTVLGAGKR